MTETTGARKRRRGVVRAWLFLFLLATAGAPAAEREGFYFEAGARGLYSSGVNEPNFSWRLDAAAGFSAVIFKALAGYTRHQRYQVTDGAGNYGNVDLGQPRAEIVCSPVPYFELSAGFKYSSGDRSFRGFEYRVMASLDLAEVSVSGEYASTKEDYVLGGLDIENNRSLYSLELAWNVSDMLWFDAGLDHDRIDFENTGAEYYKTVGRMGVGIEATVPLSVMFGAGIGRDSSDYSLYAADAGLNLKLQSGLRGSIFYSFMYYQAPTSPSKEDGAGPGGGAGAGYGPDTNPFLRSSLVGKSFPAHSVSVGFSCLLD